MNENSHVVVFSEKDPKHHTTRWNAESSDALVSSIYIRKGTDLDRAKKVKITVEAVNE